MGAKQTKIRSFDGETYEGKFEQLSHNPSKETIESAFGAGCEKETPKFPENLRKRGFFGGLSYNLNDPRSPMNRTPLVFDNDRTLDLDDTFADLFVATRAASVQQKAPQMDTVDDEKIHQQQLKSTICDREKEDSSVEFVSLSEEDTMPCPTVLHQTPLVVQQNLDPRSPTIGLTRTPIIFDDDDETKEDAMLEDILATLSLDLSGHASSSFGSNSIAIGSPLFKDVKKPTNKHLDRVRKHEKPIRKNKRATQKQPIYLDNENFPVTPQRKLSGTATAQKRTPLSCLKNRTQFRSRSVETDGKSTKLRLSLTSYDDILNPIQDAKVANLRMLEDDSIEI